VVGGRHEVVPFSIKEGICGPELIDIRAVQAHVIDIIERAPRQALGSGLVMGMGERGGLGDEGYLDISEG